MSDKDKSVKKSPNLRFPEYRNSWETLKLRDISEKVNEKNTNNDLDLVFSNSAVQGIVLQNDYFEKSIANRNNLQGYYIVKPQDFVYNPRISANAEVGAMNINNTFKTGLVSPLYTVFRIKSAKITPQFLEIYFKSKHWHSHMREIANYGARDDRMNIKNDDFYNMDLQVPQNDEQIKIISFLSKIIFRIETQKKTIQNLESLMNGVRAKIFNDNDLFLGNKKLQEIGTFFSGGTPLTSNKNYYEGTIPFIKSGEINSQSTEQFISLEGLKNSSAKLVEKGDVLIALYGATSGEVGVSKISGAINQAILCIRTEYNPVFIVNYLKFKKEEILKTFLQGGQGNLSADIIKSISIPIPEGEKQKLIVQLFSNLEKKLEIETQILGKLNLQKKFFLQNLFV